MPVRMQFRRGTAAEWTSANPTLAQGEMGLEYDTNKFKVGDGNTAWNSRGYGGLEGPTGPTGLAGSNGATGPTGAGSALSMTGTSFSEVIIANDVSANRSTPTVIAIREVPSLMKGKTGFLNAYFYLTNQVAFPATFAFNYGFALDSSLIGSINGRLPYYIQSTGTSTHALIGSNTNNVPGTGGFTFPVTIPVNVPSNASNFQAVIANSTLPLITTQLGAVVTTTFTYTGSVQTYTVPANVSRLTMYMWGAGGSTGISTGGNAGTGGSGAYISGRIGVTPGQVFYVVIGNFASGGLAQGNGANSGIGGTTEGDGAGFSGIFTSDPTSMTTTQAFAVLVALAAGGGGGGINSGATGGGGGVTAGLSSGGGGGTQTAGGGGGNNGSSPSGTAGSLLTGGTGGNLGGGGGGGYYGGGGGGWNAGLNQGQGGGGGSSFIGALQNVASENGKNGNATGAGAQTAPGGENTMYSFFGSTARWGFSGSRGAVAFVTEGTYPTYIGSEFNMVY